MTREINELSLPEKIGQLFFIGIAGPELDEATRDLLSEISPGGVCLFARNVREAGQTRRLTDGLRSQLPLTPLLSIDQEGGLVDRLRRIMTPMPAAAKIRDRGDAIALAEIIAETLLMLGLNMDFAPVVDIVDDERGKFSNGLHSRAFGRSKEDVVSLAGAFLEKLQAEGVTGCIKHFPGLGAARVDSHEELPRVDVGESEWLADDLAPYRELIGSGNARAVMVAHAAYPGLSLQETDQNGTLLPSSLSYNFISTLLRSKLAFDGLVITDDLEMGAIVKNYGIGDACRMAVAAGADMLAICADPDAVRTGYNAVLTAVESGEISNERLDASLMRIAKVREALTEPSKLDLDRLQELSAAVALLNNGVERR